MQESQISTGLDWYFKKLAVLTLPDKRAKDALGGIRSWSADKIRREAHRVAGHLGVPIRRMDDMVSDETLTDAGSWIDFFGTWTTVVADYAFAAERLRTGPIPEAGAIGAAALNAARIKYQNRRVPSPPRSDTVMPHDSVSQVGLSPAPPPPPPDASVAAFDAF